MNEVTFSGVGREKKSWRAMMPTVTFGALKKELNKHKALWSRDLEFDLDNGFIFAGVGRVVGKISVREVPA